MLVPRLFGAFTECDSGWGFGMSVFVINGEQFIAQESRLVNQSILCLIE
jgi:hypothetical protein